MLHQRRWCLCVVAVLAAGWAPVPKGKTKAERAKDELRRLQGSWERVRQSIHGGKWDDTPAGVTEVIEGDQLSRLHEGEAVAIWTVVLGASKSPRAMDLKDDEGNRLLCAYKLEGDTLTLCYGDQLTLKRRPADLTPRKGVWVGAHKRVKPKATKQP